MIKYVWLRRTSESFKNGNPVLLKDQLGYETDTHLIKIGDGVTNYNDLEYMIKNGKSAYELAVDNGYKGTISEYLESLKGKSAYEIAVDQGYEGTEEEWLASLSANMYNDAVKNGFDGTEADFFKQLNSGISDFSWGSF